MPITPDPITPITIPLDTRSLTTLVSLAVSAIITQLCVLLRRRRRSSGRRRRRLRHRLGARRP